MKTKLCRPILINSKEPIIVNSIVYHPTFKLGIVIMEDETLCYYGKHQSGGSITSPLCNLIGKLINKQIILISLDDEIKDGDLVLLPDNTLHTMTHSDMIGYLDSQSNATKKVIARQSQISPEYIQQFIGEYNTNTVKDIEIVMEELCCDIKVNGGINSPDCCHKHIIKPKLTNGFITLVTYPIGGYAPGNYTCNCVTCKKQFIGDKRAVQCKDCATKIEEYIIDKPLDDYIKDKHTQEECTGFIHGYKSRMKEEEILYTEKEVYKLIKEYHASFAIYPTMNLDLRDTWFNQNKKK